MAIGTPYHLGSAAPTTSVTTTTVTAGMASGSGDAIIVCTASTGTTGSVTGITDTKSNTYALVQRYAANSFEVECWIAQGATALTTSDTITATWSGAGTTHRMDVMGVSGVATFSAADPSGIATASSTGSTAISTGATGTLAQSGELAIAVFAYGSGGGTITWGNSYTSMASVQAGSTEFLVTGYKALSTTSGTTASGTITSAPWTALVVTFQPPTSGGGPFIWYDGTYAGWQALQGSVPDPPMFAYGPAWTTAQLATLPSNTIQMPLDDTGSSPHTTTVIDVESVDVTSASVIASWINSRNRLAGGYAANRPTVYLNRNGLYYVGAADDVITPLKNTYGLNLGQDYDLWIADTTGSQPAAPVYTLGVPCVATQYANYNQTGHSYDISIAFDSTWTAAFGGQISANVTASAGVAAVALSIGQPSTTPVSPPPQPYPGQPGIPGYVQLVVQAGFSPVAPVDPLGSFILDDSVYGVLGGSLVLVNDIQWTDISAFVRSGTITRPSTRTMGPILQYQAATVSIVLANDTGNFDPDNTGSPYWPNIRPMVPVQVLAIWEGVTYPLFFGFADSWQDDGVNYGGRYAEVTLGATDGFKVLQGITLPALNNPVGVNEDTGARIKRMLNAAQWYTGQRRIDTGNSNLQGTTEGTTPLDDIQQAAEAELGDFFQDGSGYAVFRNRHSIFTRTQSANVQAVFGDAPGTVHNLTEAGAWYMSASSYINEMYDIDPVTTAAFFNNTSSFAISTDPTTTGIGNGFVTTPVLKYSSYAQFSSDITGGAITGGYQWVLYDNEDWSQTPQGEIDDPWTYMASFTTLAHAHSYKVILTPARDLGNDATSVNPKNPGETLDQWYVRTNIAGTAASTGAEVVHIQDQANQQTLSEFTSFWNTTRAQAKTGRSGVQVSIGVSTTYGGAAGMTGALLAVSGYAGVWVNALDQGEAVQFLEQIGGGFTELPYTSASRACDDTIMANDIQATIDGTNYTEVMDNASIALSLFPRTYQSNTLLLTNSSDLLGWAQFVLYNAKDSDLRFDQLTLNPLRDATDLWPQALGLGIGDRITIYRRPPGSVTVSRDVFVRGMQHDFDASGRTWQTQFTLQDANRYTGFLLLNSTTTGILDTSKLAF